MDENKQEPGYYTINIEYLGEEIVKLLDEYPKVILTNISARDAIDIIADRKLCGIIARRLDRSKDIIEINKPDTPKKAATVIISDYFLVDLGITDEPIEIELSNLTINSNIVD